MSVCARFLLWNPRSLPAGPWTLPAAGEEGSLESAQVPAWVSPWSKLTGQEKPCVLPGEVALSPSQGPAFYRPQHRPHTHTLWLESHTELQGEPSWTPCVPLLPSEAL